MKNMVTASMVTLIIVSAFVPAFSIQEVKATGTIYIGADGSITPPTAPISTVDNETYTFTDNIISDADGVRIQKRHIVLDGAGFTLQG